MGIQSQLKLINYGHQYNNMEKELKRYLKDKSITEASKDLGVSRQTIYNWLNNRHGFTLKNWKKLAPKIK